MRFFFCFFVLTSHFEHSSPRAISQKTKNEKLFLILAINLVVCFSRNLSVIFDLSERRIPRNTFWSSEAINSGINLNLDGFKIDHAN